MKQLVYILIIGFFSFTPEISWSATESEVGLGLADELGVSLLQTEKQTPAPIVLDADEVESYTSSKEYDYYTFHPEEEGFWTQLLRKIANWLFRSADKSITQKKVNITGWILVAVVVILLGVVLIIFRPTLFYRSRKKRMDYQVEEESIHGIHFEQLIQEALAREDYSEAIRWKYLSILKLLQDRELISWELHKTVNEYVREFKRADLKQEFRNLSSEFLYVRYGHFEASRQEYDNVLEWSNFIIKRI